MLRRRATGASSGASPVTAMPPVGRMRTRRFIRSLLSRSPNLAAAAKAVSLSVNELRHFAFTQKLRKEFLRLEKKRRCPQHWGWRPHAEFKSDAPGAMCDGCRAFYGAGKRRSPEQRRARLRGSAEPLPRVLVSNFSLNHKLGGMPATVTSGETCPDACSLKGDGCFAEFGNLGAHWARVPRDGLAWPDFLAWVMSLPAGQLWRHNTAGDLPGRGDELYVDALSDLVGICVRGGSRAVTYTHKPLATKREQRAIAEANARGFTINISVTTGYADTDRAVALGVGPVTTLVPPGTKTGDRTPAGHRIVVCPAQTDADLTCAECRLCWNADRNGIVGFFPHGQMGGQIVRRLPVVR